MFTINHNYTVVVAGLSLALQKFGKLGIDTISVKQLNLLKRLPVDWHTTLQIALKVKI